MKKRLFIFIMLICIVLVGCGKTVQKNEEISIITTENEIECTENTEILESSTESQEEDLKKTSIKASIIVKFSKTEIVVFSDTLCYFYLNVSARDGDYLSTNSYGEFQLAPGEIISLTLDDLAPGFFSNKAYITQAYAETPYVYGDSPLDTWNYKNIDCSLSIKYSSRDIIVYSDTSCYFDLLLCTKDSIYQTLNNRFSKINIKAGETLTFTLEDLAPGFFSNDTIIYSYYPYVDTYVEW